LADDFEFGVARAEPTCLDHARNAAVLQNAEGFGEITSRTKVRLLASAAVGYY